MQEPTTSPGGHDPFATFRLEHVRVLEQAEALERSADAGAGFCAAVAVLRDDMLAHMEREDALLFPTVRHAFAAGALALNALAEEHDEMRLMLATLGFWCASPPEARSEELLHVVLHDFTDLLRLHIRREETAVFNVASRVFTSREAEELWRQLERARDTGRDAAPSPRPEKGNRS